MVYKDTKNTLGFVESFCQMVNENKIHTCKQVGTCSFFYSMQKTHMGISYYTGWWKIKMVTQNEKKR